MKKLFGIAIASATALTLGSCGDSGDVLLLIPGELGDKSYFDSAERGADKARFEFKDLKIDTRELGTNSADYQAAILDGVDLGYELIITLSYDMASPIKDAAEANPDTDFMLIDVEMGDEENLKSTLFYVNEGSYLAGVAAASKSRTGKIGFVGGEDITGIDEFLVGYIQGALSVNPSIIVSSTFTGSWTDPALAKTQAESQINSGADVIYHASGSCGLGVFEAVYGKSTSTNPVWAIGVDTDQYTELKDTKQNEAGVILTSMVKRVDEAVYSAIAEYEADEFEGGEYYMGLSNGGVGLVTEGLYDINMTNDQKTAVNNAKTAIIDRTIDVLYAFDSNDFSDSKAIKDYINAVKNPRV